MNQGHHLSSLVKCHPTSRPLPTLVRYSSHRHFPYIRPETHNLSLLRSLQAPFLSYHPPSFRPHKNSRTCRLRSVANSTASNSAIKLLCGLLATALIVALTSVALYVSGHIRPQSTTRSNVDWLYSIGYRSTMRAITLKIVDNKPLTETS
jgi:hypothetical protein